MEIPLSFVVDGAHPREWVIRIDKNLYGLKGSGLSWLGLGLKDAGSLWFEKLKEGLEAKGFYSLKWNHVSGIKNKWCHYSTLMID